MKEELKQAHIAQVKQRYEVLSPHLTERGKRIWAAAEALTIGRGGTTIVCEATNLSRVTVTKGRKEVEEGVLAELSRIRHRGGGRKSLAEHDPQLLEDLNALIDPSTRGDPQSPLRWTCKSTSKIAQALEEQGHCISQRTVYSILKEWGYKFAVESKNRRRVPTS